MKQFERAIKKAKDQNSGEILEADDIFDDKKDAFAIRKKFSLSEVQLSCLECLQKLIVSYSSNDRLYFKHYPNSDYCILKDNNLPTDENEVFTDILFAKESQRHKDLKNKIGYSLLNVNGIDKSSIAIDNQFIIRGGEKRKPDVYCKYLDKEIVFEIQLSKLSLRYILNRYNFYKLNGIYLIWILENFDIHNQGQLERDIKYLVKYENFFRLDETAVDFRLVCEYKHPYLTDRNQIQSPWREKSVSLNQIKFDEVDYQFYYFNTDDNLKIIEKERNAKIIKLEAERIAKIEQEKLDYAINIAQQIIRKINEYKIRNAFYYGDILHQIDNLNEYELSVFNKELKIFDRHPTKKPALNQWISKVEKNDSFLNFIIYCKKIKININDTEFEGKSVFQEIYENENIFAPTAVVGILKRGYKITERDDLYLLNKAKNNADTLDIILLYSFYKRLSNIDLIDDVKKHYKLICIIESTKRREIIGFKLGWTAFTNNAINSYTHYWDYLKLTFIKYGSWVDLLEKDTKKEIFQKKIEEIHKNYPIQKNDFDDVFKQLFPELIAD